MPGSNADYPAAYRLVLGQWVGFFLLPAELSCEFDARLRIGILLCPGESCMGEPASYHTDKR